MSPQSLSLHSSRFFSPHGVSTARQFSVILRPLSTHHHHVESNKASEWLGNINVVQTMTCNELLAPCSMKDIEDLFLDEHPLHTWYNRRLHIDPSSRADSEELRMKKKIGYILQSTLYLVDVDGLLCSLWFLESSSRGSSSFKVDSAIWVCATARDCILLRWSITYKYIHWIIVAVSP